MQTPSSKSIFFGSNFSHLAFVCNIDPVGFNVICWSDRFLLLHMLVGSHTARIPIKMTFLWYFGFGSWPTIPPSGSLVISCHPGPPTAANSSLQNVLRLAWYCDVSDGVNMKRFCQVLQLIFEMMVLIFDIFDGSGVDCNDYTHSSTACGRLVCPATFCWSSSLSQSWYLTTLLRPAVA